MTPMAVGERAVLIKDFFGGQPFIRVIVKYDEDIKISMTNFAWYLVTWYPEDPVYLFIVVSGEAFWIFSATDT